VYERKGKLPLGEKVGWEIQLFTRLQGCRHLPAGEEGLCLPLEADSD